MRLYLREEPEVVAGAEDEYSKALRTVVFPLIEQSPATAMRPVGAFRVDPFYGPWPNFMLLWSYEDGFASYARGREAPPTGEGRSAQPTRDPRLIEYLREAGRWRQRSMERLLVPLSFSPQPPPRPKVTSPGCIMLEQTVVVAPGHGHTFVESVETAMLPAAERSGLRVELIARSAGRPLEYLLMWSLPSWDAWARFQDERDPDDETTFLPGLAKMAPRVAEVTELTLVPMRYSPLGGTEAEA